MTGTKRRAKEEFVFGLITLACAGFFTACAPDDESMAAADSEDGLGVQVDKTKPPTVVSVPLRFTKNRIDDIGFVFGSSSVPFTGNTRDALNPMDWSNQIPAARQLVQLFKPGKIGSGYLTTNLNISIPRTTSGTLGYAVAKANVDIEYVDTVVYQASSYRHSPLRLRTGSNQPCLSVVMSGGLEGKLSTHDIPWYDEGFTERNWTSGSRDRNGRPIKKVIVGTFWIAPIGFADKVDGSTKGSFGVGTAGGSLMMNLDRSPGEASATRAVVHVNLVENDRGEVTVGEVFSTSGALLSDAQTSQYDARAASFAREFIKQAECWAANPAKPRRPDGKCTN